jgi:thiamine-phosphate pyrophosphorylase
MASDGALRLRGLYAVTPGTRDTALLVAQVQASLDGGAALVQYRAKDLPGELRLEQASRIARLCRDCGVPLVVNDSVELARAVGAQGVHLGRDDGDVLAARRALPPGTILGVSCYDSPDRARAAAAAGADYVAIGSIFASGTKPGAVRAPLELIGHARAASGLPVCAIGGITLANAPQAIAAGADLLAVVSAVFGSDDILSTTRAFARLFETAHA